MATRYDKRTSHILSFVPLIAARLWLCFAYTTELEALRHHGPFLHISLDTAKWTWSLALCNFLAMAELILRLNATYAYPVETSTTQAH